MVIFLRFFSVCTIILISACSGNHPPAPTSSEKATFTPQAPEIPLPKKAEYWLFAGNPGSGKSTIINSLLKKKLAGIEASSGKLEFYSDPIEDRGYIETPGLDDIKNRAQAAKEIEKALKQDGKYRIFFVIDSNGLKTRPADLDTIKTILNAINLPNIEYNIIVNKLTIEELSEVVKDNNAIKLAKSLKAGKYHTYNIRFIPMDLNVLQGNKNFIDFEPEMIEFLSQSSASMQIPQNCIKTVDGESHEEKIRNLNTQTEIIKEKIKTTKQETEMLEKEAKRLREQLEKIKNNRVY